MYLRVVLIKNVLIGRNYGKNRFRLNLLLSASMSFLPTASAQSARVGVCAG